jgi:hypothetical protein
LWCWVFLVVLDLRTQHLMLSKGYLKLLGLSFDIIGCWISESNTTREILPRTVIPANAESSKYIFFINISDK